MNRLLLGPVLVVLALTSIISPPSSIRLNQVGAPSPKELFFPSTPTDNPVAIQSTPTSAISSLQAMKSLLTQKYQDMIGNTPAPQKQTNRTNSNAGTNQNASQQVKQSMKQYQKQLMQQYNSAQNNLTFNDSVGDNIDNGLNNSIRGAKNIIHEGNSNRISGMANQVNGSNNVIGGHNSKVHGSGNIVMSLPAGTPLPPPPPMPQLPQMPKIPQIPKKIDDLKPQIAVHLNETKLNQVKDQESVLLWTNNTEAIEKCSNNETSENSSSNETQINETEIIVDKQANQQQLAEGGMEVFADASLLPSNQHIPAPKSSANTPNSSSAATSHISTVINDATVKNSWGAALALTLALFLLLLLL